MKIDFKKLQQLAQEEVDSRNTSNNESSSKYPIVYPGNNGKLTLRILYNPPFNGIQRKIIRHDSGSGKIACLAGNYGDDCPICEACNNIESIKGKEIGVWKKYGHKMRGICFAQIIDHEATYFTKEGDPKKGDVVLFMYPKTVYDKIVDITVQSEDNLPKIVAENDGIPIVIERTQKGGGFPEYNTYVYPYGSRKSFEDDAVAGPDGHIKTGEEKFDDLLASLPDLGEEIIPKYVTEDIKSKAIALAETINQEYLNSDIVNPEGTIPNNIPEAKPDVKSDINNTPNTASVAEQASEVSNVNSEPKQESAPAENTSSNRPAGAPECFGNHVDGEKKCLLCTFECECEG